MARYHIDNLKVFPGFFIPYLSKKDREKVKLWKRTLTKRQLDQKKIKVNVAILGGGDIVFPIIASGVILQTPFISLPLGLKPFMGGLIPALFIIFGALLGLTYLFFFFSKPKKAYPAMPFITAGILIGMILSYLLF